MTLAGVLQIVEDAVFVSLGLAMLLRWRRFRSAADGWLAVTFGSLAVVGLLSLVLPRTLHHALGGFGDPLAWTLKVLLAVLFLFPWFLFRFTAALHPADRRLDRAGTALSGLVVLWCLLLPRIPATHDHRRPWWLAALLGLVIVQWGSLSLGVGLRLWLAGRGQPTVARRRMQVLSLGALTLAFTLVPALSTTNANTNSASHLASEVLGILAVGLFGLGLVPPGLVRLLWRRPEERALRDAETRLMEATTPDTVANGLLPHVATIFGGYRALLLDRTGRALGGHGLLLADIPRWREAMMGVPIGPDAVVALPGVVVLGMANGWLAVETGASTPFFGREEADLLTTLAAFIDLALARAELFTSEREARQALERAHTELEGLVYSFSHDLKSPLISLLGYLDYLKIDFGDRLGSEGSHYVQRMSAAALYMTDLIQDLLELSRIGRTQTEPEAVDLGALVCDIAETTRAAHPAATIRVGPLPAVWINSVRARQLFTNLVENAVIHGHREDITIDVTARPGAEGVIVVAVADDGVGIPAPYRERVFGIFERLEADGNEKGTGIGLAICQKITEQVGGRISIADTPVGTTFEVELPLSPPRDLPVRDSPQATALDHQHVGAAPGVKA